MKKLLALPLLAILALQAVIMPSFKSCVLSSGSFHFSSALACITPFHFLTALPLLLFAAAMLNKKFFKEFAEFLSTNIETRPKATITILLAILLSFYLAPGSPLLSDQGLFQAVSHSYANAVTSGAFPDFTFDFYAGTMQFYYYGPLYFLLNAILSILIGISWSAKLLLLTLHIASALFFYLFTRKFLPKHYAFIGAIAYAISFEHIAKIMIVGRSPLAILYALAPLLFLSFEHLVSSNKKAIPAIALIAAAMFLASPADAVYVLALFGLYAFLRIIPQKQWKKVIPLALSGILFILLVSFWAVPFFLESEFVNGPGRVAAEGGIAFSASSLVRMLSWPGVWGFSAMYYVGISLLLLAAIAIHSSIRDRGRIRIIALCTAASFLLVLFNNGRSGMPFVFFLSILAAMGLPRLYEMLSSRFSISRNAFLTLLFFILLVDLGPSLIQPAYVDFSKEHAILQSIDASTLDLHSNYRTYYPYVPYLATSAPMVFGNLYEGAPRSFSYAASIASNAAAEIYDQNASLSPQTQDALFLLNTKYLILHPQQIGVPADDSFASKKYPLGLEQDIKLVQLNSSPIILSGTLRCCFTTPLAQAEAFYTKEAFNHRTLDWNGTANLIAQMQLNSSTATASAILLKSGSSVTESQNISFTLLSYTHQPKKITLVIDASESGFARLAVSYYPWLKVQINGITAEPMQTAMEFIAVPIEKGINEITVEPSIPQTRMLMNVVSFLSLLISLLFLWRAKQ